MKEIITSTPEYEKKAILERYIEVAQILSNYSEHLIFPDIEKDSYEELKAVDRDYPGYSTPTDEILEKMKAQGIKVVLGNHKASGNIFIFPFNSNDIADSLLPRHLKPTEDMDELFKELIEINKVFYEKTLVK